MIIHDYIPTGGFMTGPDYSFALAMAYLANLRDHTCSSRCRENNHTWPIKRSKVEIIKYKRV